MNKVENIKVPVDLPLSWIECEIINVATLKVNNERNYKA